MKRDSQIVTRGLVPQAFSDRIRICDVGHLTMLKIIRRFVNQPNFQMPGSNLETWTVFVLHFAVSSSQFIMTTSHAIRRQREVLRRQHKALSTEDCYTFWLRRYMAELREMPEGLPSEKKLEQFLTDLACHRDISVSTQNQALNDAVSASEAPRAETTA